MPQSYGEVMFGAASKRLQQSAGSRAQYERLAARGAQHEGLSGFEVDFIARRDSFYLGSVTEDGWPYIQHRGGAKGFLHVLNERTLAFADYSGNKQYITAGNLETNDRVALFLMSYPERARLKLIGHARIVQPLTDPALDRRLAAPEYRGNVERIVTVNVVAFDWNCSQHITPRWTREELTDAQGQNPDGL